MSQSGIVAPRPSAIPYDPSQGHIQGSIADWNYAFDPVRNPLAQMPSWTQHAVAPLPSLAGGNTPTTYRPPGFPISISAQSLTNADPTKDFWAGQGQPGAVLMGASQGDQRGGFVSGPGGIPIATLPLTLANAPMYGREGLLALLTSIGGGSYQQQADGSEAPVGTGIVDQFIGGVRNVGDALMAPFNALSDIDRQSNAATRITNVADLVRNGQIPGTIIDAVSSFLSGPTGNAGAWKFNLADLTANMAAKGYRQDEALAKLYDLPLAVVHEIMANPQKFSGPLSGVAGLGSLTGPGTAPWDLAAGLAFSVDPAMNMALELTHFVGQIAVGGGVLKGAAALAGGAIRGLGGAATVGELGRAGQAATAFTRGLGGLSATEGTAGLARLAALAGRGSSLAMKASAANNAAGWTIRGFEWAVKEAAGLSGNKELADTMDRLLWEMPLSMNPGLNLMASFTLHPSFRPITDLLHGRIEIGRRGTAGRVGTLVAGKLGVVNDEGAYLTIAGRPVNLIPEVHKTLGTLRELTIDQLNENLFRGLGWQTGLLRTYFGEGNQFGNSIAALKDGVFYAYLQAAREKAGSAAAMIQGATLPERATTFFERYAPQVYAMMKTDLAGSTHYLRDTFKGQFWDLAGRNDTRMGPLKAHLEDWNPDQALADFASWIRASGHVNAAFAERASRFLFQPRSRTDISPEAIDWFRRDVLGKYQPDAVVSLADLDKLKRTAGLIETRGLGNMLIRRKGSRYSFTRTQVEGILDSVTSAYAKEGDGGVQPRLYHSPEDFPAPPATPTGPRVSTTEPQYGPPSEVAEARVTGMDLATIRLIREAEAMAPEARANLQPPRELMVWYDRWANPGSRGTSDTFIAEMLARGRPALWQDIIDAWGAAREWDERRSFAYNGLAQFTDTLTQRAGELGLLPEADALAVAEAVRHLQDNLVNPVGMTEQYLGRSGAASGTSPIAGAADYTLRGGHEGGPLFEDPVSTWMATHPGTAEMWKKGEEDAFAIANLARTVAEDAAIAGKYREVPMQRVSSIDQPTIRAFQIDMSDPQIAELLSLARRAADDPSASVADRALLRDPEAHPLTKLPAIEKILGESDLHRFTPKVDELAAQDAAFAKRRAALDDLIGLITVASKKLSLDGDWSPPFRDLHDRMTTAFNSDVAARRDVEYTLPEHRQEVMHLAQAARNVVAQRDFSVRQAEVLRLEQSRSIVGQQTGEFGPATVVGRLMHGRTAAEAEVIRLRQADPAGSYRLGGAAHGGWYEILKAEPVAARPLTGEAGVIETQMAAGNVEAAQAANLAEEALRGGWENPPAGQRVVLPEGAFLAQALTPDGYHTMESFATKAEANARISGGGMRGASRVVPATPENIAASEAVGAKIRALQEANAPAAAPAAIYGNATRFPDLRSANPGKRVVARYRVVEAADLRTSTQRGYRTELQPRARVDRAIVDKMVQTWDQEAAFRSESGAHGAPVVDPALDVVAGNHRVVGMRELSPEQKLAYRAELRSRAETLGLDPAVVDAMKEPVLVREISAADATPELALALNTETRGMTGAPLARHLARRITPEDLKALDVGAKTSIDAALQTQAGADIIRSIVGDLPPNLRTTYIDEAAGTVTADGVTLARRALLMRALPGQYDLVAGWIEHPETRQSIEAIVTGVENALPQLSEMDSLIGFGQRHDVIAETLGDAIRRVKQLREDRSVKAADRPGQLAQGLDVPPLAGHLAATLEQLNGGEVTTFLRGMAEHVIRDEGNDPSQATLFGAANPRDLLRVYLDAGADAVNAVRSAKAEGSMFGWEALPHFPDVGQRAHYDFGGPAGEQRTMTERPVFSPEVGIIEATRTSPAVVHSGPLGAMPPEATHWSPQNAADEAYGRALSDPATLIRDAVDIAATITDEASYLRLADAVTMADITPAEYAALRSVTGVMRWTLPEGRLVTDFGIGRVISVQIREDVARLGGRDILPAGDLGAGEATALLVDPKVDLRPNVAAAIGGTEPPVVTTLRQSAADGRHTVTTDTSAARTVAGAPGRAGTSSISEFNQPDPAARAAALDTQLTTARGRMAAAKATLDQAPAPAGMPSVFGGDPALAALYDRYWHGGKTGAPRTPESAWEVLDALENLDRGVPSGDLSLIELEHLRESLHGWLGRFLSDKEASHPARRALPPVTGEDILPPQQLHREVNDVLVGLSRVVLDDPSVTPLAGFEGTQYEFGPLPSDLGLSPRLILDPFLDHADAVIPGLADEILTSRKAKWGTRLGEANMVRSFVGTLPMVGRTGGLLDTLIGGRSEKEIVRQAQDRMSAELVGPEAEGAQLGLWGPDVRSHEGAVRQVHTMMADIRDRMADTKLGWVTIYRRPGLVPDSLFQKWGETSLRAQNRGSLPTWYQRYLADHPTVDQPISQAWRRADNRIRSYFSGQPGGAARMLEHVYDNAASRKLSSLTRNLTVFYHVGRFALDVRWLGLEAVEAGILTLSKEGLAPFLEAHGIRIVDGRVQRFRAPKGAVAPELMPLGFGENVLAEYRRNWAWWLQQAEQGMAFGRLRYVLANVHSAQMARLPSELLRMARQDTQLAEMLRSFGSTPQEWVHAISETWDIANARSPLRLQQVLDPAEARRLYGPLHERGVLTDAEFADMVKAGRHTPSAAIEAELAHLSDPRMAPIMERLQVLNDQFWGDAASLIFGEADRSNLQRFFNHPLLWWPASYMVKAGRWLGGILFDRAFGHDTGMAGAWTLSQLHQRHAELLATDPEYRKEILSHPTLLFIAQMLMPVTPWDLGASLSPMTRLLIQGGESLAGNEPADPYRRNFFSWGPFYTFGSLLPRLVGEEAAAAPPGSIQERVFRALEPLAPRTYVAGPSTSRLTQAEQQGAAGLPAEPYVPPLTTPYRGQP